MSELSVVKSLSFAAAISKARVRDNFALVASAVVIVLAGLSLAGWFAGVPRLTSWTPLTPTMKANTAIAMLGIMLGLVAASLALRAPLRALLLCGPLLALVIGALSLLQTWGRVDLGVDQLLVADPFSTPPEPPGRPAPMTSLAIIGLALGALWMPAQAGSRRPRWLPIPVLAAFAIGYVASVGLLFGAEWSDSPARVFATVSLPTMICIVLLGAALLAMVPWHGTLLAPLASPSAGARLLRGALPLALLLPAALIWLEHVARSFGWWPTRVGLVVAALALAAAFLVVALFSARWIDALEGDLKASRDLLEQRVAQRTAELSETAARLDASRRQLADVVETAAAGIVTLDAGRRILLFNAEAERMFDRDAEAVIGRRLDSLLPARLRGAFEREFAQFAAEGGAPRPIGNDIELAGCRADGEEFPLAAAVSSAGNGDARLFSVVLRDLGLAAALERERAARTAAELASRAKSEFLSRISHELRTPLNAVLGFAQLLELDRAPPLPARQLDYVQHIARAGRHLLKLVGDLLDLGGVESGRLRLDSAVVDLTALARDALAMVSGEAQQSGIALVSPPAPPLHVRADAARVTQIVANLLSNAIKYNRPRGMVSVDVERDGDDVVLSVADTGPGMSSAQLAHLFEPFNRLGREYGDIDGTGIGLALSQSLAGLMHGRIEASSTVGVGSVFRLRLPAHAADTP